MTPDKAEFARDFFSQIESQVQFGDTKASLLIAGDAILLATTSGLVRMVSGCPADNSPLIVFSRHSPWPWPRPPPSFSF
jgi:hypothetical protein